MKMGHKLVVFLSLCGFLMSTSGFAADKGNFSTDPTTNNGKKWRIGYYEGGPYIVYQAVFVQIVNALMDIGWLETAEIPSQEGEETKDLWKWLATEAKSEYLEFVEDAHYSANWDENVRKTTAMAIIERLNQQKDLDLMLAAGTWAGQDLANNQHQTPTMVFSTSDPISAGIINSVEDSGYDHIHARVAPLRYERQVQIFYDIIGFQTLGVAYEDTLAGRSYAAIDNIEKVSKELGFEVVSCYTQSDIADQHTAEESVEKCFDELGQKVDAIYVTGQSGVNPNSIPKLVEIANSYRIPTFSQYGSEEVKYGFLMSISQAGYSYLGRFHAEVIAKIFNGAKPRQIDQLFEDPPKIAINLKTAEIIGYDPPVDVLGAADEIYQEIATPQ